MNPFWQIVCSNAIVAAALAIAIWLLSRVWKNPAAMHFLWLVVLLKLVTPALVHVPLPMVSDMWAQSASGPSVSGAASADETQAKSRIAGNEAKIVGGQDQVAPARQEHPDLQQAASAIGGNRTWRVAEIIAAVWILGSVSVACFYAISIVRFMRSIQNGTSAPAEITAAVERLSRKLRLRRAPEVVMTSRALPPLVWSIGGPPKVILPSDLLANLDDDAQSAVITHELVHISR
ncbi:MAG TPA: M56 family metallopeptidase, partial [Lacipirellulaceae bacterium]|nr:M56 family metallopeptidase [Lacipirellulaceae bacterium]